MWRRVMETKTVTVKFGGQVDAVDVNTFTRVLLDYSAVLQASCKSLDPGSSVNANVRAVRPGCLEVDLGVVAQGIGSLFKDPATSLQTVVNGIAITSGFYGLKKFLGSHGKAVEAKKAEDDKITITASDGATTIVNEGVLNLYMECPRASDAVNSSFATLDEDPRIESMSISDDTGTTFHADRDDFGNIASSPSYESPQTKLLEEPVVLTVVKPVLEHSTTRKWEFLWRGLTITANISDRDFIKDLDDQVFAIGSSMYGTLRIYQAYDEGKKGYVNKRYEVISVDGVKPPEKTGSLFG